VEHSRKLAATMMEGEMGRGRKRGSNAAKVCFSSLQAGRSSLIKAGAFGVQQLKSVNFKGQFKHQFRADFDFASSAASGRWDARQVMNATRRNRRDLLNNRV